MTPALASPSEAPPADEPAELNFRILAPLMRWLRECQGEAAFLEAILEAGLDADVLTEGTLWVSQAQFERALAVGRRHAGDDETFLEACSYKLAESYGPWRFLVRTAHPATLHRQAARMFHLVSRISRMYVDELGSRTVRITYLTDRQESRLMCLSRQAQTAAGPTLWDMPPARVTERSCVARGDPACVYDVAVYEHRRVLPLALGLGAGLGLAGLSYLAGVGVPLPVLGLLGLLAGYAYELHRMHWENLRVGEEVNGVLRHVAREESEARAEIVALHKRQRQWALMLEEELSDRTEAVQDAVERLRRLAEARVQTLHGVSSELVNPLRSLSKQVRRLESDGASPAVVEEMDAAIVQLRGMLEDLMGQLAHETRSVPFSPSEIDVGDLTQGLGRRLRALAFGSNVRVRAFLVREAPARIRCDPMVLDRILDNLLANAVRYTDKGNVTVEMGGCPGHLVIKISDTGRGIDPYDLERILPAASGGDAARPPGSLGSGLSVVVGLLDQIGGRLEVMSTLEVGSTFWVYVPEAPSLDDADAAEVDGSRANVVTLLPSGARGS